MRRFPLGFAVLPLLLLLPSPARSESQNGGAAIALHDVGIRVPFAVAPQPDSGALVVSADTRNGFTEAYAQRLDRHGVPQLGAGGSLLWTGIGSTSLYNIAPDGSGGALLVWTQISPTTGKDIYVQRVLPSGALAYGPAGLVVCNAPLDQSDPQVTVGGTGFFYIAWTDLRANVSGQADIYLQRFSIAGAPTFAANGLLVNTVAFRTNSYASPSCAPDLAGGLLLSWPVASPGGVRAQRVNAAGTMLFGATGAALADPADYSATIAPDGSGGLWAYTTRYSSPDYVPYAHHLTSAGVSSFPAAGIAFHSGVSGSFNLSLARNASGGCFFVGTYYYSSPNIIYTLFRQEVSSTGALLRGPNGEYLSNNCDLYAFVDAGSSMLLASFDDDYGLGTNYLRVQRFALDGTPAYPGMGRLIGRNRPTANTTAITMAATASGIVMEAHADGRYTTPQRPFVYQVFGQAFDTAGNPLWDDAENPVLVSAQDAPADQGGRVRVTWNAGAGDHPAAAAVVGYRGWRALGTALASKSAAHEAVPDSPFEIEGRSYVLHANQFWEMVAEAPASQLPTYALTLPTGQDSSAAGHADESFMVEAYDDSLHHWWSGVKVAHSVDDLAPAMPAPFTGQYAGGVSYLYWNANVEPDLAGYRLFRGNTPAFVPGPANRIATPTEPGWVDPAGSPAIYKLSAVDQHGNESPFAVLTPAGALAAGDDVPRSLALSRVGANPSRGGAVLRLALPTAQRVKLAVYDAAGRQVRALVDGDRAAGAWTVGWDGTDAAGRAAPSGLYFARLECGGRSLAVRIVTLR